MSNEVPMTKVTDKNSLNFIRILAALQVLIGHAEVHLKADFLPGIVSNALGVLQGVPVFFILSGFLIWNSISRTKDLKTFCQKRVFRLYPELWIGVLLNFVVIVVLYKKIQWIPFLAFQLTQSTFLQFWTPSFLRGYGCGTPNGSLWTIGVMLQAYIVMWFLFKILHGKSAKFWAFLNVFCIALSFVPQVLQLILPEILVKLFNQTFVPYLFLFVIGMTLCEFFPKLIVFLKKTWYIFAIVAIAIVFFGLDIRSTYGILKSYFIAPAIIGFAYSFPKMSFKYDYSYGIYIYHMIVINILIHFGIVGQVWTIPAVIILSFLLSMASYHSIGTFSRRKRESLK